MAKKVKNEELLKDKRVVKEIERHKWLESEKANKDIGFDSAAHDWLNNYSDAWKNANLGHEKDIYPKQQARMVKSAESQKNTYKYH